MASKNVKTALGAFEAFNKRDLDAAVGIYADSFTFTDHALGETMKARAEVKDWLATFTSASSDMRVTVDQTIDAGDTVIIQATLNGTNDGPFGTLPATGRRVSNTFCDILRFDSKGRVIGDDAYYDQLSLMVQLGHIEPPTA